MEFGKLSDFEYNSNMKEIWRTLVYKGITFEGYEASNYGNIRSLNYKGISNYVKQLKPFCCAGGYLQIDLRQNNQRISAHVNIIIACTFPDICGVWYEGCDVDHINTIRSDNRAVNLRVCSHRDNCNNYLTIKKRKERVGWKHKSETKAKIGKGNQGKVRTNEMRLKMSKNSTNKRRVIQYSLDGDFIREYESISECCRLNNFKNGYTSIPRVCKGKQKTSYGYMFKYKEEKYEE